MSKEEAQKVLPNVYQRISNVMNEIGTIAKKGKNTFQNYEYATEADYVHAVRPLLIKYGLVVVPLQSQVNAVQEPQRLEGEKLGQKLTTVTITYKIVNIHNPDDYVNVMVTGQGSDNGDKGIYKAITGAKKYMLANTFMIATGDDPEKSAKKGKSTSKAKLSKVSNDDF